MQYSLYSRFRGTMIGAVVSEILGYSSSTQQIFQETPQTHLQKQQLNEVSANVRLAMLLAQSLVRQGRFDLVDWRQTWSNPIPSNFYLSSKAQSSKKYVSIEVIFVTIIIALFYHDNEIELRQNLQLALTAVGQDQIVSRDGALAVGYAIACCLNEKLDDTDLITQTIAFIGPQNQMAEQLAQVQSLLEQGAGIERTVTELGTHPCTPIALAFYCCLSTLADFRLSVIRAVQKSSEPEISGVITGGLSGAYNSLSGIPATLRLALSRHQTRPLAAWGMTTEAEMLKLTDSLIAVWSGVYDQTRYQDNFMPVPAIAAPGIVRSS